MPMCKYNVCQKVLVGLNFKRIKSPRSLINEIAQFSYLKLRKDITFD